MFRILFFFLVLSSVQAQSIEVLNETTLQQRIRAMGDTTLVINFWATWCKPCVAELPHFEQLTRESVNKKLKVWLISMDFRNELGSRLRPFVEQRKLQSKIFLLEARNLDTFIRQIDENWSGVIPTTWIVNRRLKKQKLIPQALTYEELTQAVHQFSK